MDKPTSDMVGQQLQRRRVEKEEGPRHAIIEYNPVKDHTANKQMRANEPTASSPILSVAEDLQYKFISC